MLINRDEMIDEFERQIRKFGGVWSEWCVGTAKDARGPFFRRHFTADLGDGLAYREAFTTDIAQDVVAHMVNDLGLQLDLDAVREAERCSALQNRAEAEGHLALQNPAGRIVFVYRKIVAAHPALHNDQSAFHKIAA